MSSWLDAAGRFFNPAATVRVVPIAGEQVCVVVDDALADPERLVEWASAQAFVAARGFSYPGLVLPAPAAMTERVADHFAQHARARLGGRRTLNIHVRLSMVTQRPDELAPVQWQCHRDRLATDPDAQLFAASVLYLFHDPGLGGTSFYRPRRPAADIDRMLADSLALTAQAFAERYGVRPGYMTGSNDHFEQVAHMPAAWNRMILYDGGLFHSGDIGRPDALSADPRQGRLTLNGFATCRRAAR